MRLIIDMHNHPDWHGHDSYMERAPDRFVLGFCPDPRRPQALDQLKAAVEIHGVRVCSELKLCMMYDNPDALRIYRF